jgi:hypothetical protein
MTNPTFQTPEEARAWDIYVAGILSCPTPYDAISIADAMILERRKRMAPEKVERGWIAHKPTGNTDPMPCDPNTLVFVQYRDGANSWGLPYPAKGYKWDYTGSKDDIIAWRPAQ